MKNKKEPKYTELRDGIVKENWASAERELARNGEDINVCCPSLLVVPCGDTKEHCHLMCGYSKAILQNSTVKTRCIGNHNSCVLNIME